MTLLLWILTAICFVGWIWHEVCVSVARARLDQTKSSCKEMQSSRYDCLKKLRRYETRCNELKAGRDELYETLIRVTEERDELRETLARVAEAVAIERAAGDEVVQLRTTLYKRMSETTVPYLDSVIAEYATTESEPEE